MLFPFKTFKQVTVHTFFMKFPINIYYFDNQYKVTKAVYNMLPWYIDNNTYCNGFIEIPSDHNIQLGIGQDIREVLNSNNT